MCRLTEGARTVRHGGGEHEYGLEHGRAKGSVEARDFSLLREVARAALRALAGPVAERIPERPSTPAV